MKTKNLVFFIVVVAIFVPFLQNCSTKQDFIVPSSSSSLAAINEQMVFAELGMSQDQITDFKDLGMNLDRGKLTFDFEQVKKSDYAKGGRRGVNVTFIITGAWHDSQGFSRFGSLDPASFIISAYGSFWRSGRRSIAIPIYIPGIGAEIDDLSYNLQNQINADPSDNTNQHLGHKVFDEMVNFVFAKMKFYDRIYNIQEVSIYGHSWGGNMLQEIIGDPRFDSFASGRYGTAIWNNAFYRERGESLTDNTPFYNDLTNYLSKYQSGGKTVKLIPYVPGEDGAPGTNLAKVFLSNARDSLTAANRMSEIFKAHIYLPFNAKIRSTTSDILEQTLPKFRKVIYLDILGDQTMQDFSFGAFLDEKIPEPLTGLAPDGLPVVWNRESGTGWWHLYGIPLRAATPKNFELVQPQNGSHEVMILLEPETNDGFGIFKFGSIVSNIVNRRR